MEIVKFLGGFAIVIVLSLIGGYLIWRLKGKKTNLTQEANKVFNFINYKAGFYLLLLIVAVIIVSIVISNF